MSISPFTGMEYGTSGLSPNIEYTGGWGRWYSLNILDEEIELTPEQLAKIKQEIDEENARREEAERKKGKLQKFFERYIHFF